MPIRYVWVWVRAQSRHRGAALCRVHGGSLEVARKLRAAEYENYAGKREREREMAAMVEAKSLRKAVIPPSLLPDPSPGHLQSTRLALHLNDGASYCSAFVASACRVYKIEISMEDSTVSKGKESLLIPVHAQVINSSVVDRCPHRSEIQSVVLAEGDGDNCFILGTVDSYGHLIISQLDTTAAGFHIQYCLGIAV